MNKDTTIEFRCVSDNCKEILSFSLLSVDSETRVRCPACGERYAFNAELLEKFKKFARLIEAVKDAEEILGHTSVGLDIQGHSVQIPYRLLLTRLNTFIALNIGNRKLHFRLRVEPLRASES